ncbi:MAG: hypothetical protein Q9195_000518 [Heterodermia aff. obscurata]
MNSLNLLSARVIGPSSTPKQPKGRSRSLSEATANKGSTDAQPPRRSASQHAGKASNVDEKTPWSSDDEAEKPPDSNARSDEIDEKTPLLDDDKAAIPTNLKHSKLQLVARRLVDALAASLKWVLSVLTAPGVYVLNYFYNDDGRFSPFTPVRQLGRALPKRNGRRSTAQAVGLSGSSEMTASSTSDNPNGHRKSTVKVSRRKPDTTESVSSGIGSETDTDNGGKDQSEKTVSAIRSKTRLPSSSEEAPRRSIRIKVYNDELGRRRKTKKVSKSSSSGTDLHDSEAQPPLTAATVKSPTSPASSLRITKYPRAPAPPRPLVPRRQPSYSLFTNQTSSTLAQKTLVIDLDETLIHSLAKGGRMSSGHMVEVKLSSAVGFGGTTLGAQHPILYYVHKRPHCDDFLRKVCKWYNLVVFTASVQEYADPVIDWLEQERKYFSGRYYRQHCTFRNGAYIKDLSSVEPDLSKVMILDNSPLSYVFHEDNAIPIEGWINDPTDNDLLHLIPLLEALQYVTDVRALLALRRGEAEASH